MMTPTPDTVETVADRLRRLFESSGLPSLASLDALAGKGKPGHAAMIVRGERVSPRPDSLAGYARVLGTTVDHLLLGSGRAPGKRVVRAAVERARADRARSGKGGAGNKHAAELTHP